MKAGKRPRTRPDPVEMFCFAGTIARHLTLLLISFVFCWSSGPAVPTTSLELWPPRTEQSLAEEFARSARLLTFPDEFRALAPSITHWFRWQNDADARRNGNFIEMYTKHARRLRILDTKLT